MPPKRQARFNARGTVKPMKAFQRPKKAASATQKCSLFSVDSIFSDEDVREDKRIRCNTISSMSEQSTVQVSPLTEGEREEHLSDLPHQVSSIRPTVASEPSCASEAAVRLSVLFCGFEEVSSWESSTVVSASSSQQLPSPGDDKRADIENRCRLRGEMNALNERIAAIRKVNLPEAHRCPPADVTPSVSLAPPASTLPEASIAQSDFSTFIATPRPSTAEDGATVVTIPPLSDKKEAGKYSRDGKDKNAPPPSCPFHVQAAREILDMIEHATRGTATASTVPVSLGNAKVPEQCNPTCATASRSASRSLRPLNVHLPPSPAHDCIPPQHANKEKLESQQTVEDKNMHRQTSETDVRPEGEVNFRALIRHLKQDSNGSQASSANGSQSTTTQRGDNVITITMSPLQSPFFSSLSAGHSPVPPPGPPRITLVKRARSFWSGEGEEDIL